MAEFFLGGSTLRVSFALHALNRQRLFNSLQQAGKKKGFVVLQGAPSTYRFDTDHEPFVRQESFFQWCFGAKEPDLYGALDVSNGKSILFVPRLPQEYAVWMGPIRTCEDFRSSYAVDACHYVDEMQNFFPSNETLFLLDGLNTDSHLRSVATVFPGLEKHASDHVDKTTLHPIMVSLRTIKTSAEIEVMRYACRVSVEGHKAVMRSIRPLCREYQMESLFRHHCHHDGGCRHQAYGCICAAGANGAVLHYGHAAQPNEKEIQDGQMVLFDMGAEYHCYCSDITCSYPVNGRFTDDQRLIYEAVLDASRTVMKTMRPGVEWTDMHRLAERVLLRHLRDGGLIRGSDEELAQHYIGALFMPHGLGHLLGLDTHDVGGYTGDMQRPTEPGIRKLRCGHRLQQGMVITVEPGCYFISALLEPAFQDDRLKPYLNESRIRQFLGFGGVRIEDDVLVTNDGSENLSDGLPRTVAEIEDYMQKNNEHVKARSVEA